MAERYPGYDVLDKRWTASWNDATRAAVDARLTVHPGPRFLDADAFRTLQALCDRILPQPDRATPIPLAAYVDEKLVLDKRTGFRKVAMPPLREAWSRGLAALEAEAQHAYVQPFHALHLAAQDALIAQMKAGGLHHAAWGDMPCELFFSDRVMADIPRAYYAHPAAWSEIGFGGPASPRGYVRMEAGKRDPWEAIEATPGAEAKVRKANASVGRS